MFIGSNKDNNDDKVLKGRHVYGETVTTSKLKGVDVVEIRAKKPNNGKKAPIGLRQMLADEYGVSYWTIGEIWNRRNWKHL